MLHVIKEMLATLSNIWIRIEPTTTLVHKRTRNHLAKLAKLASNKEFLDIQGTIGCGFTLKRVRDMIKTYS